MKEELFPFVEKNYKADDKNRTLVGCSLGGLFSMYTLFTHPDLFTNYVAASPAYGWANESLYQYAEKYFSAKSNPPARLFMCVGGVERSVPGFEKLSKFLTDKNSPSLEIQSRVLENTGHSGTKGEGFARGLQFSFKRPSLKLSDAQLKKYEGNYKMTNGTIVEVKAENGQLVALAGNNKYQMNAASDKDFYSTSEFLNVHFTRDNDQNIIGFRLERYGSTEFVTKNK